MILIGLIYPVTKIIFNIYLYLLLEEALIYKIRNLFNLENLWKQSEFKMVNRNKMLPFPAIQI